MEADNGVEQDAAPVNDRVGLKVAVMATVTCAVLAGLWATGQFDGPKEQAKKAGPVPCKAAGPNDAQGYAAVCAALNRPDLPALLGTPDDRVLVAHPMPMAPGTDPAVEVRLRHTSVALTAGAFPVAEPVEFRSGPTATPTTVLGHPAAIYSSTTTPLRPEQGKPSGPNTRNLLVAQNPTAGTGRAFELAVFRGDGETIDDTTLSRLAEALLPTLPGWAAA